MLNPLLKNKRYLGIYLFVWLILGTIHTTWMVAGFSISHQQAIIESLIFNGLYAILGVLIWYSLFFIKGKNIPPIQITINHFALGLLLTLVWINLGVFLMKLFFEQDLVYISFVESTFITRFIVGFLYFIIIAFGYYLVDYSNELEEKIVRENVLEKAVQEAELKALKSQINPHFLFNSLNSISYLTLTEGEKAHNMIVKLSDYLRYSISNSQTKKVKLSDELNNINRYLEIEKIRFGKRLNYEIELSENCEELTLPYMVLQPLYENAIKYGVHESIEPITIKTVCICESDFLIIEITNNFDKESYTTKKGEGVGLENIKNRLRLIYQQEGLFKAQKKGNIFRVELRIPQ